MKLFLYDFARDQSWCADYWRRVFPDLRELGYDGVIFYIEHRYHFRSFPQHRPWGGFTPAQAAEARRMCERVGLKLYWETNCFGHCDGLLANETFRHLAEDIGEGEQLCPSHPETRPFLRTLLREIARLNPDKLLFIAGDEARALNRCARCRKRGLSDAALYLDHMQWVIRETKRLGKRPVIAGDMLLKYPHIISGIDKDTVIPDWHYDSGSAETIRLFQRHGFDVMPTTSSNEFWRTLYPFDQVKAAIEPYMREARELGCIGICMTAWELNRGTLMDNHWEHNAAAVAAYEGKPFRDFAKQFYGSRRADYQRLKRFFDESFVRRLSPFLMSAHPRRQFGRTESAFLFYHTFVSTRVAGAIARLAKRIKRARRTVRNIQRNATKRRFYLEFLDLPLDLLEIMDERIQTLRSVREVAERLCPHRLPVARGTRLLKQAVKRMDQHIFRCEKLAARYDRLAETRGGSRLDAYRLRKQIGELRLVRGYIHYHANTYAKGVAVPSRELWYV
jgi:hypothetical protein